MSNVQDLTLEVLKQIRIELKEGLGGLRTEIAKTNERLDHLTGRVDHLTERVDHLTERVDNVKEMQDVLVQEHRRTNGRLDFFAEELIRMRTRDEARMLALETAVAELQRKVG
jgi:predicted nuclease with TOPRIM domain